MHRMTLDGAWLDAIHELDITYPKKVEILIDKFKSEVVPPDEIRIVVLWEPDGRLISKVMEYPDFYTHVFTYHQYVLDNNPKSHFFLGVTVFVEPKVKHKKEFKVSTIVGHKRRFIFPGYKMRHELWFRQAEITIPRDFYLSGGHYEGTSIDTEYGKISTKGQKRLMGTKDEMFDAMFHIAIENAHMDNFFTEKITDCFMTKTVPIYIGAGNIGEFFNAEGIISVANIDEAIHVCNRLTPEDYYSRVSAIEDNYNRSLEYADYNKMLTKRVLEVLP